jgi:hypothetical protein
LSSPDHERTPGQSYCWERRQQCIDTYFETFHPRWPFIHKATFNIHRETPLLLEAMVAIGLWVSGEQSARCAAAELHEKLDLAIRDQRVCMSAFPILFWTYTVPAVQCFADGCPIGEVGCL